MTGKKKKQNNTMCMYCVSLLCFYPVAGFLVLADRCDRSVCRHRLVKSKKACTHRLALPPIYRTPSCVVDVAVVIGLSFFVAHASVVAAVPPRRDHDFANATHWNACLASCTARRDRRLWRGASVRVATTSIYVLLLAHHILCIFESFVVRFVCLPLS